MRTGHTAGTKTGCRSRRCGWVTLIDNSPSTPTIESSGPIAPGVVPCIRPRSNNCRDYRDQCDEPHLRFRHGCDEPHFEIGNSGTNAYDFMKPFVTAVMHFKPKRLKARDSFSASTLAFRLHH